MLSKKLILPNKEELEGNRLLKNMFLQLKDDTIPDEIYHKILVLYNVPASLILTPTIQFRDRADLFKTIRKKLTKLTFSKWGRLLAAINGAHHMEIRLKQGSDIRSLSTNKMITFYILLSFFLGFRYDKSRITRRLAARIVAEPLFSPEEDVDYAMGEYDGYSVEHVGNSAFHKLLTQHSNLRNLQTALLTSPKNERWLFAKHLIRTDGSLRQSPAEIASAVVEYQSVFSQFNTKRRRYIRRYQSLKSSV